MPDKLEATMQKVTPLQAVEILKNNATFLRALGYELNYGPVEEPEQFDEPAAPARLALDTAQHHLQGLHLRAKPGDMLSVTEAEKAINWHVDIPPGSRLGQRRRIAKMLLRAGWARKGGYSSTEFYKPERL